MALADTAARLGGSARACLSPGPEAELEAAGNGGPGRPGVSAARAALSARFDGVTDSLCPGIYSGHEDSFSINVRANGTSSWL